MLRSKLFSPLTWPVLSFAVVILLGSLALRLPTCWQTGQQVTWLDALFISTSAVCVTGLAPIDMGSTFNLGGQGVLLALIQLGGLGITTYTSLIFVLWRNRVPFNDRLAVSQALLNKDIFDLRAFVVLVVQLVLACEGIAALLLWWHDPVVFHPFSALFHAVSAFCNAGFGLLPENLMRFRDDGVVNAIIGGSVVLGGLGFAVLREIIATGVTGVRHAATHLRPQGRSLSNGRQERRVSPRQQRTLHLLDRHSRTVIKTSLARVFWGGLLIYVMELIHTSGGGSDEAGPSLLLPAFFQSISARTAGFNTVDLTTLTDASLLVLVGLMFIGGSPGSCAGGIKTTTLCVLLGFMMSQIRGDRQIIIEGRAVNHESLARALTLFFFSALIICLSVVIMCITENGLDSAGNRAATPLLSILFEVVSALGTVGLSMNLTPHLSQAGKVVIILNMFVGRVGFITLLAALQSLRSARSYEYPTVDVPIG